MEVLVDDPLLFEPLRYALVHTHSYRFPFSFHPVTSHFFFSPMSVTTWSSFTEESSNETILQLMQSVASDCADGVFGTISLSLHYAIRLEEYYDG